MSVTRSSLGASAMSLIELLCVIAIIALLAALLLPALGQAKARARRIQCIDHLHQTGVGFVSFANDHNGQFPMTVPASAGGTLELARGGSLLQDDFYFSSRHFQAASNDLLTPKLLICPADSRPPATDFPTLSNGNLSYFVAVNAECPRSTSILAGDRNLTNDHTAPGTLARLGQNYALRWTEELHRFKGNLLFADAHVEQKNNFALIPVGGQSPPVATLAMPTLRQYGAPASSDGGEASAWAPATPSAPSAPPSVSFRSPTNAKALIWPIPVSLLGGSPIPGWVSVSPTGGASRETPSPPKVEKRVTNSAVASTPAMPEAQSPSVSQFGLSTVAGRPVAKGMWWLCPFLLLLAVVTVVLLKLAHGGKKRAAKHLKRFS